MYRSGQRLFDCAGPFARRFRDSSVDMGTGYDCFDVRSHPLSRRITGTRRANRLRLRRAMVAEGFEPLSTEWWHFTLRNEPYPRRVLRLPRSQELAALRQILRCGGAVLAVVAVLLCCAAPAQAAGDRYVALGDSYTSGPLIPNQVGTPIDCGRSDRNYPSLTAPALRTASFTDVSCGSAQTKHMTQPQTDLPAGGTNPPQFNALRRDTTLVTVGIGGNDAGLVGVAENCAEMGATQPTGTACRDRYAPGGKDQVAAKIEAAKPRIAAVLAGHPPAQPAGAGGHRRLPERAAQERQLLADGAPEPRRRALHRRSDHPHQHDDPGPGGRQRRRVRGHLRRQHRPRRVQAAADALVRGPGAHRARVPAASQRPGRGEHGPLGDQGAAPAREPGGARCAHGCWWEPRSACGGHAGAGRSACACGPRARDCATSAWRCARRAGRGSGSAARFGLAGKRKTVRVFVKRRPAAGRYRLVAVGRTTRAGGSRARAAFGSGADQWTLDPRICFHTALFVIQPSRRQPVWRRTGEPLGSGSFPGSGANRRHRAA